jgi:hypothetical protein
MNVLIRSIPPYSNPEESALPKSLIRFDHSIEIWLAEVARVSRAPAVPRWNDFAKRKGGPRNVVQLLSFSFPSPASSSFPFPSHPRHTLLPAPALAGA